MSMDILAGLTGLVIGAVAAWQLTKGRAAVQMSRLRAQLQEQIRNWQDETERARASAARLSEQTAAWIAGCQQGREDVLSLTRALSQQATRVDDDPAAG
jgi:chromosome segregation ATPase